MVAVSIPMLRAFLPARDQIATRNLNYLNGAVVCYNQSVAELNTNAAEAAIVGLLQTRDASRPGSPYLPSNLKTNSSSNASTYRATWTGRMFEQRSPGTNGSGLDLLKLM